MDIAQFLRVIRNNLLLLIAIPILLALVVFYFTRNQDSVYESEAIIYTGITTGYSIESTAQRPTDYFSTSAQFDNLINLINSRQTIVESAIMLYAQNLSLEGYNSQYISNENYDKLMKNTPKHVKDMVVKNGKAGVQREKEEQIRALERELKSLEREINKQRINGSDTPEMQSSQGTQQEIGLSKDDPVIQPQSLYYNDNRSTENFNSNITTTGSERVHIVKAGETLLTIARQYGVSMNHLREINNLSSQELRSGQRIVIERSMPVLTVTNQQYKLDSPIPDDAESDQMIDDVYDPGTEDWNAFIHQPARQESVRSRNLNNEMIDQLIEKDPIIPIGVREDDFNKTVQNFTNYYNSSDTNYIYGLLHYGASPHYSIRSLKKLQIYRISNSDLVRLVYTSDDPGICQQTLKIIAHVFVKNYKLLKESQTDMVVDYFRRQVDSADMILKLTEDKLLTFNRKNNIINYPEQTKFIAEQKEQLDLYYSNEQVRMAQSAASLRELETKLTRRDSIYLKSDVINQKRKEYADITERILINELAEDYDKRIGDEIALLRKRADVLRDEIKLYVDQLYLYSHSTQGLPIARLLDEWLKNALTYEEAKASLVVLARRKLDFVRTYQRFAPLGAILKRIEREMTIAEQTYLELLRSLNLAKMRQQNLQMATNIRIVDPPYFPLQANPSRAKYLVVAAALIGFFLVLFIILMLEYFDMSLKNPDRAVEKIGLKLAGAYPYLGASVRMKDATFVTNRLVEMIIQNIKRSIALNSVYPARKPYLVLFFSTQGQVGKTLIMSKVANKLRTYGERVLMLNYAENETAQPDDADLEQQYQYFIRENFPEVRNLRDLINAQVLRRENTPYDYILLEIPSIIFHSFPMELISQVDAAMLVVKANAGWTKADEGALEIVKELAKEPPMVILNEAEDYAIREMISGVKSHRTDSITQRLKHYITLPARIKIQVKEN
ncbi:MAG TPA: LysM peptidoglycan-binding domain-containing protein [Bacteroidales bacterium]|nr:LysM peptidoglycan-binding domain-containing protein [Bacteroidales bacterium]